MSQPRPLPVIEADFNDGVTALVLVVGALAVLAVLRGWT